MSAGFKNVVTLQNSVRVESWEVRDEKGLDNWGDSRGGVSGLGGGGGRVSRNCSLVGHTSCTILRFLFT